MFGLGKTLKSLVLVVAFLVLAALATFFYNADQEQKKQLVDNPLVSKGGQTLGALVNVSEKMTEVNVEKNIGMGKKMADLIGRIDWRAILIGTSTEELGDNSAVNNSSGEGGAPENLEQDSEVSFWNKIAGQIKTEWQKDQETGNQQTEINSRDFGEGAIAYQKTSQGADIIITSGSGAEYRLPLPFKFLGE